MEEDSICMSEYGAFDSWCTLANLERLNEIINIATKERDKKAVNRLAAMNGR